jgi:hypothetical protein
MFRRPGADLKTALTPIQEENSNETILTLVGGPGADCVPCWSIHALVSTAY